ncbi:hypothetical protein NDU88_005338 [Pleurodeles waltl]|uniref:Uncharacterized protein n=1 Tax=Pleurodeles waltl TaxID=8319 RepID=A0AAV7UJB1_PLEWA|nr:hypothetical protein NDU88_005338 [Pleurodeles waltl]
MPPRGSVAVRCHRGCKTESRGKHGTAAIGACLADRVPRPPCGRRTRYVLLTGSSASRSCWSGSGRTTVVDCRCLSLIGGTRGAALQRRRRPLSPCGGAAPLPSRPTGARFPGLRPSAGRDGHGWDRRPTFLPLAGGYFQRCGRPGGRAAHTALLCGLAGRDSHLSTFFFFFLSRCCRLHLLGPLPESVTLFATPGSPWRP